MFKHVLRQFSYNVILYILFYFHDFILRQLLVSATITIYLSLVYFHFLQTNMYNVNKMSRCLRHCNNGDKF